MTVTEPHPDPAAIEAAEWCEQVADGLTTLEQQIAFETWLDADPRHRTIFERMAAILIEARRIADAPEVIDLRADALQAMRDARHGRHRLPARSRWSTLAALAACLLLLLSGVLYQNWHRTETYATGIGERRIVRLADGSQISLDAASRLEVSFSDERRDLRLLTGRAKFDVAKDPRRPFTVTAAGKQVVATGTSFSVELLARQMRVILYEGHVAVLENGPRDKPPRPVRSGQGLAVDEALRPGKAAVIDLSRPAARVEQSEPVRSLAWERGQLVFTDEPLDLAVQRVNRYSDLQIVVGRDIATVPVSGAFNAGDLEGFVDGLQALYGFRVKRDGQQISLSSGKT